MIKAIKTIIYYLYVGDYSLVYFAMLTFSFVILGYFGILPGFRGISAKQKQLAELTALESKLKEKEARMFEALSDYNAATEYISALEYSLPSQAQTADFLTEFTVAAGEAGFTVDSFKVTTVTDDYILATIEVNGEYFTLPQFLARINKLNRVAILDVSDTKVSDRGTSTRMIVILNFLSKEENL